MFDRIKSGFPERKVRYMSTNILPARRKGMIAEVKSGYGKGEILVSTPIIEAGVDIDFDIGFRDICPIDNLVQFI